MRLLDIMKEAKVKILLTLALPLALVAGGCGGESAPLAGTTAPRPSTIAATSTTAGQASCDATDILPALQEKLGPSIVKAEVVRCQNDYALVNAVPDKSACPPTCYETQEAYLRWTGERWRIVDFGTGIECEDTTTLPPLPAAVRRACRALGYPQPAIIHTNTFQMPSRNIGCALSGRLLRCDILSGLKPEPRRPCELDWVGLVLRSEGPAQPNCAGDTVYDAAAPTLAYGDIWHRADFWCESQQTGLLCFNPGVKGGSFQLSRETWEG